jgi:membrane protease subunit HflK
VRVTYVSLGLAALATLLSSVAQIQPDERVVVRRFGRVLDEQPGPGLHFFLPWGLDQVDRVKVQVREVTVGYPVKQEESDDLRASPPGQLLTGDHNLVNLQATLYYTVKDGKENIERYVLLGDRVDMLLMRATESAMAEWAAGRPVEVILLEGKLLLPGWLFEEVSKRIDSYDLGIQLSALPSVDHQIPRAVKASFDRVGQTESEVEAQKNRASSVADNYKAAAEDAEKRYKSATIVHRGRVFAEAQVQRNSFEKDARANIKDPTYALLRWWNALSRIYAKIEENGRVEPLDHYLTPEGKLNITTIPGPRKK